MADGQVDVAALLRNAAERREQADKHEAEAVRLSASTDADSIARATHHFIIAAGLRGRARFR